MARAGHRRLLACLALAPFLSGFTSFDSLEAWEAAVGAHQLEDFDDVPAQGIPAEGGSIDLEGFSIVADGNHGSDGSACDGLCQPKVAGGVFVGDIHDSGPDAYYDNLFEFDAPIRAFAMNVLEIEDSYMDVRFEGGEVELYQIDYEVLFVGVLLDAPISTIDFAPFGYSNYTVDDVRWAPVPEPSTGLLVAAGFLAIGCHRSRSRRSAGGREEPGRAALQGFRGLKA